MVYLSRSYSYDDLSADEDPYVDLISKRANHMAAYALDDSDASVRKSRRHDEALRRNINARLAVDAAPVASKALNIKKTTTVRSADDSAVPYTSLGGKRIGPRMLNRIRHRDSVDDSYVPYVSSSEMGSSSPVRVSKKASSKRTVAMDDTVVPYVSMRDNNRLENRYSSARQFPNTWNTIQSALRDAYGPSATSVAPVSGYSYRRKTVSAPKPVSATAALKAQETFAKPSQTRRQLSRIQDYWHEGDLDIQPRVFPKRSVARQITTYKKGTPRYSDYYYPEFYRFSSCTPVNQASTILSYQKRQLSQYEPEMPPPSTYMHLRERLRTIHDGVDRQRLMIDRYIPVDLSATDKDVAAGIINKYEEMSDRMPTKRSSKSTTKSSSSASSSKSKEA